MLKILHEEPGIAPPPKKNATDAFPAGTPSKKNEQENELFVKLFGIGSAGASMVSAFKLHGIPHKRVLLDTTRTELMRLAGTPATGTEKILLGREIAHGIGTGTRADIGEKAAEASETEIRAALLGTHLLFLVTALGRGTGSGASVRIAKIAHEMKITTVCFATMPFAWEGTFMSEQAVAAADKLRENCNAFVLVEKDLIAQQAGENNVEEAFRLAGTWIEKGIDACGSMLFNSDAGLCLDFAAFQSVFPVAGAKTLFAIGTGTGENALENALKELFRCQLLDARTAAKHSDTLVIHLRSGFPPSMERFNEISRRVREKFGGNERTLPGFRVVQGMGNTVEICVIGTGEVSETRRKLAKNAVKTRKNETGTPAADDFLAGNLFGNFEKERAGDANDLFQGALLDETRGVFQDQRTRLYEGIDLDRPTYLRQQRNLDKMLKKYNEQRAKRA